MLVYLCMLSVSAHYVRPGDGGGGVLALEMGRGVPQPPAYSKPDPVPIRFAAKKTPCPNLEMNTEFNWSAYGVITTNIFHVSWSF